MEHFWNELAKVSGPIPITVQAALEQCKFLHGGLAYLDDAAIDAIEADIRQLPVILRKSEQEIAEILGGYPGDIKEFRFLVGERSALKLVAANISRYGFNRFYKVQSVQRELPPAPEKQDTSEVERPREDTADQVKVKICAYYDRRRDTHDTEETDFCGKLEDMRVQVCYDNNGDLARIACPFCDPKTPSIVMIRRDKSGTWKISNFSAHIKYKHEYLKYPGKDHMVFEDGFPKAFRKRSHQSASNEVPTETVYEDSCDGNQDMISVVKMEASEW